MLPQGGEVVTFRLATAEEIISRGTQRDALRRAAMILAFRWTLGAIGFVAASLFSAYAIVIAPDWVFWTYISSLIALVIWLFVRSERQ